MDSPSSLRTCLLDPIPELYEAAALLDEAVSAHLAGDRARAEACIRRADMPGDCGMDGIAVGPGGPWSRPLPVANRLPFVAKPERMKARMPGRAGLSALLARDGYHCRFCGIPVIRAEVRMLMRTVYPEALRWGSRNVDQHAGFHALWLTYDHLLPHARGGSSDLENMLVTCQPCNCGRSNLTLDEVGLADPRPRPPVRSTWDELERFRP